jgi:cellulose synthase/poly-beta-1,6-N-acetylglucosamine synthase-like glycosyltransferase
MILQWTCGALLSFATLVCAYYLFLALIGLYASRPPVRASEQPTHTFLIVIPAHDEENTIDTALTSCTGLDYPANMFRVHVIADNCSDRTAPVAARHGARVHVRNNPAEKGKGPALEWGLKRILTSHPADAVIILDADCQLDARALRIFDHYLGEGEDVLQANYQASNPDESPVSYVGALANILENHYFYAPKAHLGLGIMLRGTGMVFRQSVLMRCPMRETSIVEDSVYSLRLINAGFRVKFVPELVVSSAFPAERRQLRTQRTRWIGANLLLAWRRSLGLMLNGLLRGRLHVFDLGWTLLILSRSLMVLMLGVALLLAVVLIWQSAPVGEPFVLWGAMLAGFWVSYFGLGIWHLGLNQRRRELLQRCPGVLFELAGVTVLAPFRAWGIGWQRTPR